MNTVIISGYLGKDAETKQVNDKYVHNFSLATSKKVNGNDVTYWHNIVYWTKNNTFGQYLKKGSAFEVMGELTYRSYENKDGQKVYITEIIAQRVEFAKGVGKIEKPLPKSGSESINPEQPDILSDDETLPF